MATISYLLCAGRVIQDTVTGKYSYIDIFDRIMLLKDQKSIWQAFYIAGKLSNIQAGKYNIEVQIIDPESKEFGKVTFVSRDLVAGDATFSAYYALLNVEKVGRYNIKILINGKVLVDKVNRYYFDVVRLGE